MDLVGDSHFQSNQITQHLNQILTSLLKYKEVIDSIELIYPKEDIGKIDFSRINNSGNNKCNFCIKIAYYLDTNNKYYCWFHRSQYE